MSKIIITKGKLLKGDKVVCFYNKQDSLDTKPTECEETHHETPHQDLRNAFAKLAIHSALIGEFVSYAMVPDINNTPPKLFEGFVVTGFTRTLGDDEGVMLSAYKTLRSGKILQFNTPLTRYEDGGEHAYKYMDKLIEDVSTCENELVQYLNGKNGPDAQGKLDFPVTKIQVLPDETPKPKKPIKPTKATGGKKPPQSPENPSGE